MSTRVHELRPRRDRSSPPHLRVVRRARRGLIKRSPRRRVALVVLLGGILAVVLVFAVLLEQVMLAQSAFRLSEIRERLTRAERRYERLVYEAVLLDNPSRIERVARQRLGMVEPDRSQQKFVVADVRVGGRLTRAALDDRRLSRTGAAAAAPEGGAP